MLGKISNDGESMINRNNNFQTFPQSLMVLFRSVISSTVVVTHYCKFFLCEI